MYMVEWDGYISLDRLEIAQSVNYLGGSSYREQVLNGEQILAVIDQNNANGASQQSTAADIISGMCQQMSRTTDNSRLGTLADYLAAHMTLFDTHSGMSAELLRSLVFDPKLGCSFPTLSQN